MGELLITRRNGDRHLVLFSDEDADLIARHRWHVFVSKSAGHPIYACTSTRRPDGGGTTVQMHAYLMGQPFIDHINRNSLDNRRENLRVATQSQNLANTRSRRGSTSAYKGVSWSEARGKWLAQIKANGRAQNLGRFLSEEDAARAYDNAALAVWGPFALLNFPQ